MPDYVPRGVDLVHLVGLDFPPPRRTPFVVMIHDLAPIVFDDEGSSAVEGGSCRAGPVDLDALAFHCR